MDQAEPDFADTLAMLYQQPNAEQQGQQLHHVHPHHPAHMHEGHPQPQDQDIHPGASELAAAAAANTFSPDSRLDVVLDSVTAQNGYAQVKDEQTGMHVHRAHSHALDSNAQLQAIAQQSMSAAEKPSKYTERPHQCTYEGCTKKFPYAAWMRKHLSTHNSDKPHRCDVEGCSKSYTDRSALTKHKRTHTGERPFVCDFQNCGSKFALVSHLTRHKAIHSADKRYPCKYNGCGKAFSRSDELRTHERVHTGERPYTCNIGGCQKTFTQASALSRHRKTQHGAEETLDLAAVNAAQLVAATHRAQMEVMEQGSLQQQDIVNGLAQDGMDYRSNLPQQIVYTSAHAEHYPSVTVPQHDAFALPHPHAQLHMEQAPPQQVQVDTETDIPNSQAGHHMDQ